MQREREVKKMWMTDQECRTSEQEGGGGYKRQDAVQTELKQYRMLYLSVQYKNTG